MDADLKSSVVLFLETDILNQYKKINQARHAFNESGLSLHPLELNESELERENQSMINLANSLLFFHETVELWLVQIRPALTEIEPLHVSVQKELEKCVVACQKHLLEIINNAARFYMVYGKALKRVEKHPNNFGYVKCLEYTQNVRVQEIKIDLQNMAYNLYYLYHAFKKNWDHMKDVFEKTPHLFS